MQASSVIRSVGTAGETRASSHRPENGPDRCRLPIATAVFYGQHIGELLGLPSGDVTFPSARTGMPSASIAADRRRFRAPCAVLERSPSERLDDPRPVGEITVLAGPGPAHDRVRDECEGDRRNPSPPAGRRDDLDGFHGDRRGRLSHAGVARARRATREPISSSRCEVGARCLVHSCRDQGRHRAQPLGSARAVRRPDPRTRKGDRHEHRDRGIHLDPPLPLRRRPREARRSARTDRRDTLAEQGAGRRPVAGCRAGDAAGARAVLAGRVRLRPGRGAPERAAAVRQRDRWCGRPLHPCEVVARERAAVDHDSRLARLRDRDARLRRPADGSDRARR